MKKTEKNKYGQYFTPESIADFMVKLSKVSNDSKILEPCAGDGIFISSLLNAGYKNIDAYEIDETIGLNFKHYINYSSFVSLESNKRYDLIIGNPPYIRWQNLEEHLKEEVQTTYLWNRYFNSLCDYSYIFILKSIELLEDGGELIFITPEYWLSTTHSLSLRNYMLEHGYFEVIYHFNETPIFEKVTISFIIFKYVKSSNKEDNRTISLVKYYSTKKPSAEVLNKLYNKELIPDVDYLEIDAFVKNERWLLTTRDVINELSVFESHCGLNTTIHLFENNEYDKIGNICDIGNGLVSGLDKAFQINGMQLNENESNSILKVVKAKDLKQYYYENITKYIFVNNVETEEELAEIYPNFYQQLIKYKTELEERYNYNKVYEYWKWVFLRNYNLFSKQVSRIFIPCKERISHKNYFRFSFADANLYPTQDVTAIFLKENVRESIYYILAMLNNHRTFTWLKYNGIVKGNIVEFSEKPISSIPIRLIDWKNAEEVEIHGLISAHCKSYVEKKNVSCLKKIETYIDKLF